MVRVQKRDKSWEEFVKSKVENGVKGAGATSEEAARIAEEISKKVAKRAKISAEELSDMVVDALEKVNKTAAKEFRRFRAEKLKSRKKKR
jgi:transcriptional regulator NrdR family protein